MAYFEFCCRSGGSNLNAGTRKGDSTEPGTSASFTYASGNWVGATGVFTVASGNPSTDGIVAGDMASIYVNGATVTNFLAKVTAVSSTTITVTVAASTYAGTIPADGTANRTLKIGGAWKGPNGAEGFPFNFYVWQASGVGPGVVARINFKNDADYVITAGITHASNSQCAWQGYTTTYGDGGKAAIDGGTTGASYTLLALSGIGVVLNTFDSFIFKNNGATGSAIGVNGGGDGRSHFTRCVVHDIQGNGFQGCEAIECEAYNCNKSNTSLGAGFVMGIGLVSLRCFSHHNTGSNAHGFYSQASDTRWIDCISAANGSHGFNINNISGAHITGCDAYANGGDGFRNTSGEEPLYMENCNSIKNTGWGYNMDVSGGTPRGIFANNAFGSGAQANTAGDRRGIGAMIEIGTVTYASGVNPYTDPDNGDFTLKAGTRQAGRGAYTQTDSVHYSARNTVSNRDIGAAQHADSGGGVAGFPASRLQLGH